MIQITKNLSDFLKTNQMTLSRFGNGVILIETPRVDGILLRHIAIVIAIILETNKDFFLTTNFTNSLGGGSSTILTFTSKKNFLG